MPAPVPPPSHAPAPHAPARQPVHRGWLSRLVDRATHALPAQCSICKAWPSAMVCTDCSARFAPAEVRCRGCALLLAPGVAGSHCGHCLRARPRHLQAAHAAVSYHWPWHHCVEAFKFRQQTGWAAPLAALMAQRPDIVHAVQACDVLIPLSLHRQRLAERGYNQALLLARALRQEIARHHGLPAARAVLHPQWLQRTRYTTPQSSLPVAERHRNMQGAFAVAGPHVQALQGKQVVLVDDVMTTGASLESAARALTEAGAGPVVAVVLARTEAS